MNLYDISNQYVAIMQAVEDEGGELTPEQVAKLEALDTQFEVRAENIAKMVKNIEAEETAAREEAKRLSERARTRGTLVDNLKKYLKDTMERMSLEKLTTPDKLFTIAIQNNSRPSIKWQGEPSTIPESYRKPPELDGTAAYNAWKSDKLTEFGWDVTTGKHLRIR